MLRIRLRRTGKKKQASYRVVVADADAPRDGAFVEILGHYNPRTEPNTVVLNEERVRHWLGVGAQPSETLQRIFFQQGLTTVEPRPRPTQPSKVEVAAARAADEAAAAKVAEEAAATAAAAATAEAEAEAARATAEAATADGEGDGAEPATPAE